MTSSFNFDRETVKRVLQNLDSNTTSGVFTDIETAQRKYDPSDKNVARAFRLRRHNYKDSVDIIVNYVFADTTPVEIKQVFAESIKNNSIPELKTLTYSKVVTSFTAALSPRDIQAIETVINPDYIPPPTPGLTPDGEFVGIGELEHPPGEVDLQFRGQSINLPSYHPKFSQHSLASRATQLATTNSARFSGNSNQAISSHERSPPLVMGPPYQPDLAYARPTSTYIQPEYYDNNTQYIVPEIRSPIESSTGTLIEYKHRYLPLMEINQKLAKMSRDDLNLIITQLSSQGLIPAEGAQVLANELDPAVVAQMLALHAYQSGVTLQNLAKILFELGINIYNSGESEDSYVNSSSNSSSSSNIEEKGDTFLALAIIVATITAEERRFLIDWLDLDDSAVEIIMNPHEQLSYTLSNREIIIRVIDGLKVSRYLNGGSMTELMQASNALGIKLGRIPRMASSSRSSSQSSSSSQSYLPSQSSSSSLNQPSIRSHIQPPVVTTMMMPPLPPAPIIKTTISSGHQSSTSERRPNIRYVPMSSPEIQPSVYVPPPVYVPSSAVPSPAPTTFIPPTFSTSTITPQNFTPSNFTS